MRKIRPWLLLLLALTSGGAAAYLALRYLRQQATPLMASEPHRGEVALAMRDLPVGHVLAKEDIKVVNWPGEAMPEGFISSNEAALGRGVITPLRMNEPLLETKLASKDAGGGLPLAVNEGLRALSVRVDEVISVAGFVVPGTRVDVLLTMDGPERAEPTTKVILQNVQALAAGQSVEKDKDGKPQTVSVHHRARDPGSGRDAGPGVKPGEDPARPPKHDGHDQDRHRRRPCQARSSGRAPAPVAGVSSQSRTARRCRSDAPIRRDGDRGLQRRCAHAPEVLTSTSTLGTTVRNDHRCRLRLVVPSRARVLGTLAALSLTLPGAAVAQRLVEKPEQVVSVSKGASVLVINQTALQRFSMGDPAVAEAVVVSPTEVLVNGKNLGTTTLVLWDNAGTPRLYSVVVTADAVGHGALSPHPSSGRADPGDGHRQLRDAVGDRCTTGAWRTGRSRSHRAAAPT